MVQIVVKTLVVHVHYSEPTPLLERILQEVLKMSKEVDDLKAEVAADTTVMESAKTLIEGLAAQLHENATDPAAIREIADQLLASRTDLATAVTANTPAAADTGSGSGSAGGTDTSGGTTDTGGAGADTGSTDTSGSGATDTGSTDTGGTDAAASGPTGSTDNADAGSSAGEEPSALDPTVDESAGNDATQDQAEGPTP
jgi:hypothetical protein